jgi:hypothetical protein
MNPSSAELHHLVRAMLKLDPQSRQWQNVVAFILSCYACRVMTYDLDAASAALERLTADEQQALIASILRYDARQDARRAQSA